MYYKYFEMLGREGRCLQVQVERSCVDKARWRSEHRAVPPPALAACSLLCRSAKLLFRVCFSAGRMARSPTGIWLRIRLVGTGRVTTGALGSRGPACRYTARATPPSPCQWYSPCLRDTLGGDPQGSLVKGLLVPVTGQPAVSPRQGPTVMGRAGSLGTYLGELGRASLGPWLLPRRVLRCCSWKAEGRGQRRGGQGLQRPGYCPTARTSPPGPAGGWRSTAGE